ncbi:MAG: putative Ig domain-containing protein, partial [Terracidiphilus sp.]
MRFAGGVGRGFGRFALVLSLLVHAFGHASGQVAPSNRSLPAAAPKTDQFESAPLDFAQKAFPDAMIGVPYQSSVQAIGGSGLYGLSAAGDMPPGLSMETGGSTVAFGGVPTATGNYEFQITIHDANGTSLNRDFTIHVSAQVPGARALLPIDPADTEAITVTDVEAVFFPAVVIDIETFTFTDRESGLDAAVIVDNEHFTFTDTESGLDAAVVVDNEHFTFTDTETVNVLTVPTITWATPAPITYGTPLSGTQLDASSTVAGTFAYSPVSGTVLPAGTHTLSVTFTPTDTTAYATATATVQLTVNPAVPAAMMSPTPGTVLAGSTV